MSREDLDRRNSLIVDAINDGMPVAEVARLHGITRQRVYQILDALDVPIPPRPRPVPKLPPVLDETDRYTILVLRAERVSLREIARLTGIPRSVVSQVVQEAVYDASPEEIRDAIREAEGMAVAGAVDGAEAVDAERGDQGSPRQEPDVSGTEGRGVLGGG